MTKTTSHDASRLDQLLVDALGAAHIAHLSRSKWFQLLSAGKVPAPIRTFGARCPRWSVEELRDWIRAGCPDRLAWETLKAGRHE